jgi:prepilin-type N-terminal cleavage/methylation domain-containing protein
MKRRRAGFTLVEVLVTMMLLAIVMPVIMKGISLGVMAASDAKRRTEAAGLAQAKLSELVASQEWASGNLSGDFSPNWPAYKWQAAVQAWPDDTSGTGIQELDLTVTWMSRGKPSSLMLSTLASTSTTAATNSTQ